MKNKVLWHVLFIGWFLLVWGASLQAAEVKVVIDFPPGDSSFSRPTPFALIAGRAQAEGAMKTPLDLAVVIDRSGSTGGPSGADIDGDGVIGEAVNIPNFLRVLRRFRDYRCTDPNDSVLSAEVVGTVKLFKKLARGNNRVSVLGFSGEPLPYDGRGHPAFPEVVIELPLTADPAVADMAAYQVMAKGSFGGTNMAAAIRTAIEELLRGGTGRPTGQEPNKRMLLLSDGRPSMPAGSPDVSDAEDQILAIQAAHLARRAGIRIHTYALGPKASARPFTLAEVARVTGGRFTPASNPSEIIAFLEDVNLVYLDSLKVENVSLGKPAAQLILGREGFFIAKVPVEAGINIIKATALAIDGTSGEDTIVLHYLETREAQGIPELDLAHKGFDELKLELQKEKGRFLLLNRAAGEALRALELEKAREEEKDLLIQRSEKQQKMDLEIEPR